MKPAPAADQGFSLIEMLIVVAIIGILAAVAIPAYTSHVKSVRRDDAKQILMTIKAAQEMYFALEDRYTPNITDLEGFSAVSAGYYWGPGNHWRFQVSNGTATTFTATGEGEADTAWDDRWMINDSISTPVEF